MRRLRLQLIIVLLALVAIAGLLLSQQPTLQAVVVLPEPAAGGAYIEALIGQVGRFNPTLESYNPIDRDVNRLVFSGLLRYDDRGSPQPDLAESWGISRDGTVYNFALQPEAIWHDGQPVTSDDLVFTIELMRDTEYPAPKELRDFWRTIDVRRMDEKTIQFRLPEPYSPFLDHLTFGVLPQHVLGNLTPDQIVDHAFNLSPIGSGPYRFDSLIIENGEVDGVVLQAFEGYYQNRAFIDTFTFRYFSDLSEAISAYQNGEVLGIRQVTPDSLPQVLAERGVNLFTGRLPEMTMILFNLSNEDAKGLQDIEVRQALYSGLNRQWMIDHILGGQAILAHGPILPGTWAYYENIPTLEYDPDGALSKLRAAGYTILSEGGNVRVKEDVRLQFELVHPDTPTHTAIARAIRDDWLKLGVEVNLRGESYADLITDVLEPREYQIALIDLNLARSPDPDPYPFWHQAMTPNGQNYSNWNDRTASEYLEAARVTVDTAERTRLYRNFQVRFVGEIPSLPLFYPVYNYAVDNSIRGVRMGPLFDPSDRLLNATQWFLFVEQSAEQATTPTAQP